ncbi:MAG: DUF3857 domain-containing protein [Pseudomonadota bacterium]
MSIFERQRHALAMIVFAAALFALGLQQALAMQIASQGAPSVRESRSAESAFARAVPLPAWIERGVDAPAASSSAALVVRLSDTQLYVDATPLIYSHRVVQANDASMLSAMGRIEIAFHPEYQKVDLHFLQVRRAGKVIDKTQDAGIRFLQREQALDEGIYTGAVTAAIVVDDLRVGDTLEIAYSISGDNPVFGGKFFHSLAWDNSLPTLRKRVTLNSAQQRPIGYRLIGHGAPVPPRETVRGERRITQFAADNLAALDLEPYAPQDVAQFRQIQFSEFKSWKQVAQWAQALFAVDGDSAGVQAVSAPLRKAGTADAMVQQALEYVQSNIRYLSVSLGENSHRPYRPDLVLTRRYGDCKDKALLLVTLLRQLGIDAAPVLVSTFTHKGLQTYLPTPLVFDHAIVRVVVDGKVHYLDPTRSAQYGPLARMGQAHAGAEVLVVAPDTEALSTIAPPPAGLAGNTRSERAVLATIDGAAEFTVEQRYTGLDAEHARFYFASQSKEQLGKLLSATILRRYASAQVQSGPTIDDQQQSNTVLVAMRYRIPHFLEKDDSGWQFRFEASNMRELFYVPESPRRTHALAVPREAAVSRYQFELTLPDDFDAHYRPEELSVRNGAFEARRTLSFSGHTARASVALDILADRVAAGEVPAFMADLHKLSNMIDAPLQIGKDDLKDDKLGMLLDAPLKQRLAQAQQELAVSAGTALGEARARGASAAPSLCERALAYARLGRKADAMADLQALGKDATPSAAALRCRADIAFFSGDMKGSEAEYGRVMVAGGADGTVHFQRAMANYALGRWRDAAEGYVQAYALLTDEAERARADILHSLAMHRLNPRAHVASLGAPQDGWRGAMFAAIDGSRSDDEVLRQIHHQLGDELELALGEAYYFLAQHNLVTGNKLKALAYLQRSIDKGVLSSALRPVARFELDRLQR